MKYYLKLIDSCFLLITTSSLLTSHQIEAYPQKVNEYVEPITQLSACSEGDFAENAIFKNGTADLLFEVEQFSYRSSFSMFPALYEDQFCKNVQLEFKQRC